MGPVVYDFEGVDGRLTSVPLAARRLFERVGRDVSLPSWRSLAEEDRWQIARAGADEHVRVEAAALLDRATPAPAAVVASADPSPASPPGELTRALGKARPLDVVRWQGLSALDRYVLVRCVGEPEKLGRAYDEIARAVPLSHLTATGAAHMVDIQGKVPSARRAVASACIRTTPEVVGTFAAGRAAHGDVLGAARVAAILGAKRTPALIPLCHPVRTTMAAVDFELDPDRGRIDVKGTVEAFDRTGVEMEALVAVAVASLAVYDAIKGMDRWATIDAVRLEEKSGGKSGAVSRPGGKEQ